MMANVETVMSAKHQHVVVVREQKSYSRNVTLDVQYTCVFFATFYDNRENGKNKNASPHHHNQ